MIEVGWREKIKLPEFSDKYIKAKMDTGARSSALHVVDLYLTEKDGQQIAEFSIVLGPKSDPRTIPVTVPVVDIKRVRSSNGTVEDRPMIRTIVEINGASWPIEMTLTDRSNMQYRMLIGRDAMAGRIKVCPAQSYMLG